MIGEVQLATREHFLERPVVQARGQECDADLTGLKLSPTSRLFLERLRTDFLPALRQKKNGERPLSVLELGSGCGLLGLGVASMGHIVVCLHSCIWTVLLV